VGVVKGANIAAVIGARAAKAGASDAGAAADSAHSRVESGTCAGGGSDVSDSTATAATASGQLC
jgi:hypothetical protein